MGCGNTGDAHAAVIQRVKGCEIVGVCDTEPLMAKQLYERFPIKAFFSDLSDLLKQTHPDVVHIATPSQSHFEIARQCLEQGSHVYVEPPFTLNVDQAQNLVDLATRKNLKLTVGYIERFSQLARRMRSVIESGYLGGVPAHMVDCYVSDLESPNSEIALLGDKERRNRRFSEKSLQNLISHGVARVAEFLNSDAPQVIVHRFVGPPLEQTGKHELIDEIRLIIYDEARTAAYLSFSRQMRPSIHQFWIYGSKNGLFLDQNGGLLIRLPAPKFKGPAIKLFLSLWFASQYLKNLIANVGSFLTNDFHSDSGMKGLIECFYYSIRRDAPVPIPYQQILVIARITDAIFNQFRAIRPQSGEAARSANSVIQTCLG